MKTLHLFSRRKIQLEKFSKFFCVCLIVAGFTSCADGFEDDEKFSSSVTNTQLESPDASKVKMTNSTDDKGNPQVTIEWPVVYGAGGYQFSFYNVDDPDNPVSVGEEDQLVDGCSAVRPTQEDTKYEVVIWALGSEKYNNKTAVTPTEVAYTTLVPSVAVIPDGSDLAEYFAANPIAKSDSEQAFELEAGGSYTLNGVLDLGLNWITLRGDKIDHPKLTYGIDGRLITKSGLKLKFMDIDCSALSSGSSTSSLLLLNSDPASLPTAGTGGYYFIEKEIAIQSCNISGLNKYLLYDNNVKYTLKTFRIQDCVVAINSSSGETIYMQGGGICDLYFIQNTFYGLVPSSSSFFIRYNNSARPTTDRLGFISGSFNIYNNTFYNVVSNGQMGNYSGMNHANTKLNLTRNLFVNCGDKYVIRRMSGGTNMARTLIYNCYWYDGGFAEGEEMGHSQGDNATANKAAPATGYYDTPTFAGPVNDPDPTKVNFTVVSSTEGLILNNQAGDPRWLPSTEE